MSVINPNEAVRSWRAHKQEPAIHVYLSQAGDEIAALVGARVAGCPLNLSIVPVTDWIDGEELDAAALGVIQVDADTPSSIKRFELLAKGSKTPLIAAAYEPPLSLVRSLLRSGAHDVLPLPLDLAELEASMAPLREELEEENTARSVRNRRIVSVIKSVGGAGATAVLGQLAIRFAENEAPYQREACLIDLDVQFGNAAFQLGLNPGLSVADLMNAGPRLDGDLLRSVAAKHSSGLNVIAAPPHMMPLESISSDQLLNLVQLAGREYGTVFLDLPSNWTNWSLSLLALSDVALLLTELSVTGLQRARRQLQLLTDQQLEDIQVRVVANRFEKGFLRTIKPADVRHALGRDIAYTIANEPAVMQAALEQGVPIAEVKRRSALGKDIDALDAGVAGILGLER
jgi:pilus assembly protein CpaE